MSGRNGFSIREVEVLELILQAKSRKMIASELNISIHTVDTHLRNIHLKTKTHSMAELIMWLINNSHPIV